MTKLFGLLGYPLSHSFSKKYFTEKFKKEEITNCSYENFERKNASDIRKLVKEHPGLVGLNVTIPHKMNVVPFMDSMDPVAKIIGAVNCVMVSHTYENTIHLRGFNTDA